MAITKRNVKKHARRLKHATESEFDELHAGYQKLTGGMRHLDSAVLMAIAIAGMAGILIFDSGLFDFIGLVVLVYPFYIFAQREGHQEGYYEGYYDRMKKGSEESGSAGASHEQK